MRRRDFASVVLAIPIGLGFTVPASASDPILDAEPVDRFTQVVYELNGPDSSTAVLNVNQTVVTPKGEVLSKSTYQKPAANPPVEANQAVPFACLNDRDREGFQRHNTWEMFDQSDNEFVHFQYFPFSQRAARAQDGRPSQQWLVCATGGVDAQNGSRTTVSGPIVAYKDEHVTYKIGQVWREGMTPADHTVTLGFEAGKDPVHVNGSIQQTATERLKGSPLAPFNDNRFGRNQTAGWWEHGCRPTCRRWNGSADFQGSVVEALFEFPDATPLDPTHFYYSASVEHFCANPFGC
jgi:hypothetical protein